MSVTPKVEITLREYLERTIDDLESYLHTKLNDTEIKANIRMESLKEALNEKEVKTNIRIDALKEATTLAKKEMDVRLENMNEFRGQLKDQGQTFAKITEFNLLKDRINMCFTRDAHDQYAKRIDELLNSLNESRAEARGKATQNQVMISTVLGLVGIMIGLIGVTLRLLGM